MSNILISAFNPTTSHEMILMVNPSDGETTSTTVNQETTTSIVDIGTPPESTNTAGVAGDVYCQDGNLYDINIGCPRELPATGTREISLGMGIGSLAIAVGAGAILASRRRKNS